MCDYVAFVDESGTKQKASTPAKDSRDFGVAVALILPSADLVRFRELVDKWVIRGNSIELTENTHITDFGEKAETIRKSLYQAIAQYDSERPNSLAIVHEAIATLGFHDSEYETLRHLDELGRKRLEGKQSSIAISRHLPNPSAHARLLSGVFLKARGYVTEQSGSTITIYIDEADESILDEAGDEVRQTENLPTRFDVNAWDIKKNEKVCGEIRVASKGLPSLDIVPCTIKKLPKTDCCIFAADIIANAVFHCLGEHAGKNGTGKLNERESLKEFPLMKYVQKTTVLMPDCSDVLYGGNGI